MSLPPPTGLPQPPESTPMVCYRHPDREAGRRCTRCGRWACTQCLVRADIGSQCVECARAARPSARARARDWNARQPVLVTYTLMAINVAVFVWMIARDPDNLQARRVTREQFDLALAERIGSGPFAQQLIPPDWYRLISSGFLHFGVLHILFNMFLLFQLGNMIEPVVGRLRFGMVYFAGLLGGSAGALLLQPNSLHGGASGAVFGLLGAAAAGMMQRGINPLSTSVGMVIVLNLMITFTIPGISIGGHLGGAICGFAAGWFTLAPRRSATPEWVTYVAPVAVAAAAVAAAYLATRT